MKTHKPKRVIESVQIDHITDDELLAHCQSKNFWDTLRLTTNGWMYGQRLFGNANIGMLQLSNMQVSGQLFPRGTHIITNWYARTNVPIDDYEQLRHEFAEYTKNSFATLVIGDRVTWQMPVSDLMRSWRGEHETPVRWLWPLVVPDRQNVSVNVDTFNGGADRILSSLDSEHQGWSRPGIPYGLAIHLETVYLPREIYVDDYSTDDVDEGEIHLRWRRLVGRLIKLLTRTEREHQSTVEHIASWVGGLANDLEGDAAAQTMAIADAIREGRPGQPPPPAPDQLPQDRLPVDFVLEDPF